MNKSIILYLVAVTLFTLVLFRPFSLHLNDAVVNVIDPLFYAWNLQYNANTFLGKEQSVFDTNIFFPLTNTIAYSDTLWGQSLFVNPLIWITHNPIFVENVAVLLSFPLAAIAMFLLAFHFTSNKIAAFLSGMFYAFSYSRLSQIGHLPTISNQWLPLYLLFLFRFLKDGKSKNFIFLCICYLLSITSSIYFGVFLIPITVLIIVTDFIKHMLVHTISQYKKYLITILPIIIPFIIFLSIALLPYIRLKAENPGIKRSIDDVTHLRASLIDYINVLPTSLNRYQLPTNTNEHVLFPTFTLLFLAMLGLVTSFPKYRYTSTVFVLLACLSFILSLGNEQSFTIGPFSTGTLKMPYYYLYKYFPLFQIVRVPARFSIFIIISLSVLASGGIDYIMKKTKARWVTSIILCAFIFEVWQTNTPFVTIPLAESIPAVYTWIHNQPEPMILAEFPISLFYHGNSMEDQLDKSYKTLQKSDTYALETYRVYFSAFHKKRMINGYSGYLPENYNKLAQTLEGFPSEASIKALQDIGVTHAVVHIRQYEDEKRSKIINALTDSSQLTLFYSNDDDLVYTVHKRK